MPVKESTAFMLSLGASGLKILASGTSALVLSMGVVAVGLIGIGVYCYNKASENKTQKMH